jgi:hypothetical protein
MVDQPIPLSPAEIRALITCPLHYHFLQQPSPQPPAESAPIDAGVRAAIHALHAAGGPARVSIRKLLAPLAEYPAAQVMVEHYYLQLRQDWPRMLSGNETIRLPISVGAVRLALYATWIGWTKPAMAAYWRFCCAPTAKPARPTRSSCGGPAMTIYHAVVASAYRSGGRCACRSGGCITGNPSPWS